jgi:hypothetical protein
VNLLEKQLGTVYFKDVRFPWVTLYLLFGMGNDSVINVSRLAILPENFKKKIVIPGSSEYDIRKQW